VQKTEIGVGSCGLQAKCRSCADATRIYASITRCSVTVYC